MEVHCSTRFDRETFPSHNVLHDIVNQLSHAVEADWLWHIQFVFSFIFFFLANEFKKIAKMEIEMAELSSAGSQGRMGRL